MQTALAKNAYFLFLNLSHTTSNGTAVKVEE